MNLPEIREADAAPRIGAIYADIRAVSGVPVVNFVWRHLATVPGALDWAWEGCRPIIASEQMQEARARLAAGIPLSVPQLADWRAAGMDAAAQIHIGTIAAAYVRGNLTNLLALRALHKRLLEPDAASARLSPRGDMEPVAPPLDPLPRMTELTPQVADLVRNLAARHGAVEGVVPSIYLHLAPWPELLRALPDWLSGLLEPQCLAVAAHATRALADRETAKLLPTLAPPPPASRDAIEYALEFFGGRLIPDLLPVCLAIEKLATPPHAS